MPDLLYHFSEDPGIRRFEPHVAASSAETEPLVWAIDAEHADIYYFPRQCPRVTFFAAADTTPADRECFLGFTTARRVAAIEASWLPAMRATVLYRYVLPGAGFELRDEGAGYWVARHAMEPLHVEPVGDLLEALAGADVELRIVPSLWPLYEAVVDSSLGFSIIRWHNAAPQSEGSHTRFAPATQRQETAR